MSARRLMAVLAHPDDESLGIGGILAKYAAEGVETFLVTATRGDAGRYGSHRPGDAGHPGRSALGRIREAELRAAASVLGVKEVALLDYPDQELDRAHPQEAIAAIATWIEHVRPDVVVTFGPDGAYGHPDHIAISQFATAAVVAAGPAVAKLYYIAWPAATWTAYQHVLKKLTSLVDGVERQVVPWPDWAITTAIDTRRYCDVVCRAIACHESQIGIFEKFQRLTRDEYEALWGEQCFYRVFSRVNGGRTRETDLFEGIRR